MSECLHEPFRDQDYQRASVALGMWAFLAQEALFFGVLFAFYVNLRVRHPEIFAQYGHSLDWRLAAVMTAVLLVSSFTMVLAVRFAFRKQRRPLLWTLAATAALGVAFLVMKAGEYAHHFERGESPVIDLGGIGAEPGLQTFFGVYFVITGFHALHVLAGIAVLSWLWIRVRSGPAAEICATPVMATGLYWHFVDIVWLFVFPALYLIGRVA